VTTTWIERKTSKGWTVDSCHFGSVEDGQRALWNLKKANKGMEFRIKEVLGEKEVGGVATIGRAS
jgi:hypothetical protein